jgi:FkbM family methyltransferase
MERIRLAAFRAAQSSWLALRGAGRTLLGPERFDALVDRTGLRRLKARSWLSEMTLPDGGVILYRPHDQCIIEEVYGDGVYSGDAIKPGQTVVDVGGHIGAFALMAARRVGPAGRVIVFEPSPDSLRLLRRNLERNDVPWVRLHETALAEKDGTTLLYTAADGVDNPAADSLVESEGRRPVTVTVRTLDAELASEGVGVVDHLKIDVEGAELRVLDGGPKALAAARRVVMEIHTVHVPRAVAVGRLEASGFKVRVVSEAEHSLIVEAAR